MKRSPSHSLLEEDSSRIAKENMRKKVLEISETCKSEEEKLQFLEDMKGFQTLFNNYINRQSQQGIDWENIKPPSPEMVVPYSELAYEAKLSHEAKRDLLNKLVVLKLNGGLGTSMGCTGPKSVIEVHSGFSFLDLTVRQIEKLNATYNTNVPLVLMNSFNTHDETEKILLRYQYSNVQIYTFNQHRYPRIMKETLEPAGRSFYSPIGDWYPPGHGDVYESFLRSSVFSTLTQQGKEFVFISNIDNLGATVDFDILNHIANEPIEFIMEVTDKTLSDIKGGTLINYNGKAKLLEIAQVPSKHVDEFKSIKKFKIFNTNNLWAKMEAIERLVNNGMDLDIIVNGKVDNGRAVIQLEVAAGAAIQYFSNAIGVNVPRSRFLPVKSTSDLFVVQSNLYSLKAGALTMNPKRPIPTVPLVKLGDSFKTVNMYLSRFASIPDILELDHLTVSGDVTFGSGVVLKGTVIIVANHGSRIDIPSGSILENKVVSGNLRILDH